MSDLPYETRSMGRACRAALALLSSLLLVTCTDNPAGPDRPGLGMLRVAPQFDAFSRIAPLTLDNVQIIVVRPAADTLANVHRGFSVTSQQLSLGVPILLSGLTDNVDVTLRLFAGPTLLFEGTSSVQVTAGAANLPNPIPVSYQGPGSSVASLALSPRDTILQTGDSLAFQLSAADSQQSPVAQYYVSWKLVGVTAAGARLDATGRLRAPGAPDLFYVKVATPNGTTDSTSVTIVPRVQPGIVTWTGAVDSQWSTAGNWNSGKLPSAVDSVLIPATNRNPVLTANAVAGAVNVSGGGVTLNGDTLTVARSFATTGSGTLTMQNPTDLLAVGGNARFAGGSTAGLLTAGHLTVGGTFTQLGGTSNQSFAADSNHVTELDASLPVISFATPGLAASHFAILEQGFTGTDFQFATDVAVAGYITSQQDGFSGTLRGSNVALTIPSIGSMRLDGVRLVIDDPTGAGFGVFGIQFSNLPTTVAQLTIRSPGSATGPYPVSSVTFVPLSASNTGAYISATDVDGVTPAPLIVYVDFDPSGNGATLTQVTGGAQVFWPSTPVVWTGLTSTDWSTATNWNDLRTPFGNIVVIPSGTPNSPQLLGFGANQASLTVLPGATLDLGVNTLSVNGAVDAGGLITGSLQGGGLTVGGTARGNINVPLTLTGVLNGRLALGGGAGLSVVGNVDLVGNTLAVSGNVVVNGLSSLTMTHALDSLLVTGDASMCGGTFTAGVVKVSGNFSTCLSANAYSPSGLHKTLLGGASPRTITITSLGGTPTGSFHILDVSGATGGLSLLSPIVVDSVLVSTPVTGTPGLFGGGNTLSTRQVQVSRLLVDQVPLTVDELGTALLQQFDNVTFQNDTTSTLLSLTLVGAALAPRSVAFNGTVVSFNGTNTYVQLVSSNGQGVTVVLVGSNNPTGGPSRSNPAFGNTVNGARILWQ